MSIVTQSEHDFSSALEHVKGELNTIRGNRAHPSLVEDAKVDVYGSEMRLKEVASVSIPEARTILVQPWDKAVIKDIERSLTKANLNLGIQNDGTVLRLSLPALTEESRQQMIKILHQKLEQGRVQLRQIREKIRETIIKAERDKEMSEDERFAAQDELEAVVAKYMTEIKELGEHKEEELTTI